MLTKATIVTYNDVESQYHEQLATIRENKIDELTQLEKTDGTTVRLGELQIKRFWLDQAAADEWIAFMQASAAPFNIQMTFVVEDIPT
jgi:phosphate-selective porin